MVTCGRRPLGWFVAKGLQVLNGIVHSVVLDCDASSMARLLGLCGGVGAWRGAWWSLFAVGKVVLNGGGALAGW